MKFQKRNKDRPNSPEKANSKKKNKKKGKQAKDPNRELAKEVNTTLRWLIFFVCVVLIVVTLAASGNGDQIGQILGILVKLAGLLLGS